VQLRQSFGRAVLVLERINTPEPPRYLVFVFLAFFLVLGFLIMSAEVFSAAINKETRFLAILVHDCFVAFLALASFFFDSKDLIATGLLLDGGLGRFRHILHLDLRFFMRRLRHHSKGEASADDSCCNQFPGFHVIFSLTPFRLDLFGGYFAAISAIKAQQLTQSPPGNFKAMFNPASAAVITTVLLAH
jgi:hypothetical protein